MRLSLKEKKILTLLHEAKIVNGKFLKDSKIEFAEHFIFSEQELKKAIKKFIKNGLISEVKVNKDDKAYFHTGKVSKDMIYDENEEM